MKPCGPRCSPAPVADPARLLARHTPNVEAGFSQAAVFSLVTSCPLKTKNFSIILGVSKSPPMQLQWDPEGKSGHRAALRTWGWRGPPGNPEAGRCSVSLPHAGTGVASLVVTAERAARVSGRRNWQLGGCQPCVHSAFCQYHLEISPLERWQLTQWGQLLHAPRFGYSAVGNGAKKYVEGTLSSPD